MFRPWQLIGTLWRRCRFFFFTQKYWLVFSVIGVLLEITAVLVRSSQQWSTILGGIGGSVLATVLVSFAGPAGEQAYQSFLRLGVTDFFRSRAHYPKEGWVRNLAQARHHCILLGQAHGEWCRDAGFRPALVERLRERVQVEIFFLNPDGAAAALRDREDSKGFRDIKRRIRTSIKEVWDIRNSVEAAAREYLTLYVYDATPSLGLTWIDGVMLVTHYLAGSINLTSPLLVVEERAGPETLYAVYAGNVQQIREHFSTEIIAENINQYVQEPNDEHGHGSM